MIAYQELKKVYEDQLQPQLSGMEADRKTVKKWRGRALVLLAVSLLFLGVLLVSLLAATKYSIISGMFGVTFSLVVIILSLMLASIFALIALLRYNKMKEVFKKEVITRIVALLNPEFEYQAKGFVPEAHYLAAGFFPDTHDRYGGDDLITGVIDKTPFLFSDLKVEEKKNKKQMDERKVMVWKSLFKGLFFVAEFNKSLNENTFVVPEKAHTDFLGKEKKGVNRYGKLVKLENPEFEKIFSVYGSSQQEARYILTPAMMEAIVNVHKMGGFQMMFSFVGSNVYCAIPRKRDTFEPKVSRSVEYKDVEEMYMLLHLIETIIKEMNLNTRIWTKE
ncbi:MAG: hypothetical protein CSA95_02710 [Bacteroidetes bacterium]|nr:MAG: hypothetical protein CSA95_02710 [Bacteroidota bacterium]